MTPNPDDIDYDLIAQHACDALNVNWEYVVGVWMTGSFTNPDKEIDDDSDIDVILVHESLDLMEKDFQESGPAYHGGNPAEVPVRTVDGESYGRRTMDLFSGYTDPPPYEYDSEWVRLDTRADLD